MFCVQKCTVNTHVCPYCLITKKLLILLLQNNMTKGFACGLICTMYTHIQCLFGCIMSVSKYYVLQPFLQNIFYEKSGGGAVAFILGFII